MTTENTPSEPTGIKPTDDEWFEDNWTEINGGGVVTNDQLIELKTRAIVSMLNGTISWEWGCGLRKRIDEHVNASS
jgi:hypothetical protein